MPATWPLTRRPRRPRSNPMIDPLQQAQAQADLAQKYQARLHLALVHKDPAAADAAYADYLAAVQQLTEDPQHDASGQSGGSPGAGP